MYGVVNMEEVTDNCTLAIQTIPMMDILNKDIIPIEEVVAIDMLQIKVIIVASINTKHHHIVELKYVVPRSLH
jgi:hypothetical protein